MTSHELEGGKFPVIETTVADTVPTPLADASVDWGSSRMGSRTRRKRRDGVSAMPTLPEDCVCVFDDAVEGGRVDLTVSRANQ